MHLSQTSILWRINMCTICLGALLYIIGFATDAMLTNKYWQGGLWKQCDKIFYETCLSFSIAMKTNNKLNDEVTASRWILGMSLSGLILNLVVSLSVLVVTNTRLVHKIGAVLAFFAVLTGIIGSTVFVVRTPDVLERNTLKVGWSYTLLMVALSLMLVSGILHVLDRKLQRQQTASSSSVQLKTTSSSDQQQAPKY